MARSLRAFIKQPLRVRDPLRGPVGAGERIAAVSEMPTKEDRGLTSRLGPLQIDWPRSLGYFGGTAAAVAFGIIEPPLGLFIAAIPFLKMLNRPEAPMPMRFVSQMLDGASKPVGGDTAATVELRRSDVPGLPKEKAGR
jgi:hypothetical protein